MIMSICWTTLIILLQEYPNGLTKEELFEKAKKANPPNFFSMVSLDQALGTEGGLTMERGTGITCWKVVDGKIYYDPIKRLYAPTLRYGFDSMANKWLEKNGKQDIALQGPITPKNSERCPYGIYWSWIAYSYSCSWDYETSTCGYNGVCLCGIPYYARDKYKLKRRRPKKKS